MAKRMSKICRIMSKMSIVQERTDNTFKMRKNLVKITIYDKTIYGN